MIIAAGCAALICHFVLLFAFAFNHRKILSAMGEGDGDDGKAPLCSTSTTAFVGVIFYRFLPTFVVACTAASWISAAYNAEGAAYTFVVLPVAYAVLLLVWWLADAGKICRRGGAQRGGSPHGTISRTARSIQKNQEKELRRRARAYNGTSLKGSNAEYYAANPGSAVEMMAIREASAVPSEQSPYLESRRQELVRATERAAINAELSARQNRINEAFEEYVEAVRRGADVGLFIVDGEVIPVDQEQKAEIEQVMAQRGYLF